MIAMSKRRPYCNCTHCRTGADRGRGYGRCHILGGSAAEGAAGVAGFAAGFVRGRSGSSVDRRFATNDAEDFHRSLLPEGGSSGVSNTTTSSSSGCYF